MQSQFSREIKVSAVIIAASILVFAGAFYFLRGDLDSRAAADEQYAAQIDAQSYAIGALAQNTRDASVAASYQKAFDALLPSKDEILNFPSWLSSRAQIWGVTVSIKFGNETPPSGSMPGFDSFSLSVEGQPSDVASFLDDIESKSTQYLVSIDSLDAVQNGPGYTVQSPGKVFFK